MQLDALRGSTAFYNLPLEEKMKMDRLGAAAFFKLSETEKLALDRTKVGTTGLGCEVMGT